MSENEILGAKLDKLFEAYEGLREFQRSHPDDGTTTQESLTDFTIEVSPEHVPSLKHTCEPERNTRLPCAKINVSESRH